jgi:NADH-quinone oxidoreductase subunit K
VSVPIHYYLALSVILFLLGMVTILARRNLIYVLMGVEMILNASALNFVAFARHRDPVGVIDGSVYSTFIIVLAAAEAAVALAIVLNIFGLFQSIRPQDANELRE